MRTPRIRHAASATLAGLALFAAACSAAAPGAAPLGALPSIRIGEHVFERARLANGLCAVAVHDAGETVSVFVVVGAGKRHESAQTTGLAHLVEHAMFSGTPTTGTDVHERTVAELGGEANAYTREDTTTYYDHALPVAELERVLAMEADRLRNLSLEQAPVLRERDRLELEERRTFQPSEGRDEALEAAVFRAHPYAAGLRDEQGLTRASALGIAEIRAFYERYYHPNNVCVVVAGPLEPSRSLAAIRAAFGAIPRGPELEPPPSEPWPAARGERLASSLSRDKVELVWLVPELGDPARAALAVLAQALERRELPGGEPVEARLGGRADRDLFRLAASGEGARAGLAELAETARSSELDLAELAELKALARDDFASQPLRARPYFSLAATFGVYQVLGHPELPAEWQAAVDALGAEDLRAAAERFLAPERCVTVVFEGTGAPVEPWPDDPAGLQTQAIEAADSGDLERAIEGYTRLLERGPNKMNTVIFLATRGELYMQRRDFDAAIADFQAALEVVDYPAVRELLHEADAQKAAALRGEFADEPERSPEASAAGGRAEH